MILKDLTNGQTVKYRTGIAGRSNIEWNAWDTGTLYVARRIASLPKTSLPTRAPLAGQILTLTINNSNAAEFSEAEYDAATNTWMCEEHLLEIEGLTQ